MELKFGVCYPALKLSMLIKKFRFFINSHRSLYSYVICFAFRFVHRSGI